MADAKHATDGEKRTVVEEGTAFRGSLSSSCPILVRGQVDGELSAPSLTVSASGAVRGTVKVGELRSEGEIAGEFDADVVQLSGRVRDNTVVRAKSLEVKLAPAGSKMQVIFGECTVDVGDAPSREAAAEPSSARPAPSAAAPAAPAPRASQRPDPLDAVLAASAEEPRTNGASVRPPPERE